MRPKLINSIITSHKIKILLSSFWLCSRTISNISGRNKSGKWKKLQLSHWKWKSRSMIRIYLFGSNRKTAVLGSFGPFQAPQDTMDTKWACCFPHRNLSRTPFQILDGNVGKPRMQIVPKTAKSKHNMGYHTNHIGGSSKSHCL